MTEVDIQWINGIYDVDKTDHTFDLAILLVTILTGMDTCAAQYPADRMLSYVYPLNEFGAIQLEGMIQFIRVRTGKYRKIDADTDMIEIYDRLDESRVALAMLDEYENKKDAYIHRLAVWHTRVIRCYWFMLSLCVEHGIDVSLIQSDVADMNKRGGRLFDSNACRGIGKAVTELFERLQTEMEMGDDARTNKRKAQFKYIMKADALTDDVLKNVPMSFDISYIDARI